MPDIRIHSLKDARESQRKGEAAQNGLYEMIWFLLKKKKKGGGVFLYVYTFV